MPIDRRTAAMRPRHVAWPSFEGTPREILQAAGSLKGQYLARAIEDLVANEALRQ